MKSSFKKLPGSKVRLEVTLGADDVRPYYERVQAKALGNVRLKGFRPGMAPKAMAEAAVDNHAVMEQAIQDAIRHSLNEAVEEHSWVVIDSPRVEITSDEKTVATDKGLAYRADLTIYPEIELPDYKKIAHKELAVKKDVKVTEPEIKETLDWLRKSRAPLVRAEREAKKGDVVEIDIKATSEGKDIGHGKIEGDRFELGNGKYIPGFEEKIAGHKSGEELRCILTAPADYWKKDLRDKKLDFEVKIKAVFEAQLAETNDDFAKSLGKFENLEALRKSISDGLQKEKELKESERIRLKILDEIVAKTKADVPEIFVDRTIDGLMAEHSKMLESSGEDPAEVRKSVRPSSIQRVMANLALTEIAKKEHLEPTKEEIEEEAKNHAGETAGQDAGKIYDYIYGILINRKVFEFLEL